MAGSGLYGGQDPREMPVYGIAEAAHYLLLPPSTLRDWVKGRSILTNRSQGFDSPYSCPPSLFGQPACPIVF